MEKRVLRTRCYERQYRLYCQEFRWLEPLVKELGLDIGHIHNISDEPLKGSHLDEVIGLFRHPKREDCKMQVYALDGQGKLMGALHPPYAFEQTLFTWAMRVFGFARYAPAWSLREGILAFAETRSSNRPGVRDATIEVRYLVQISEWQVKSRELLFPCLELRILTISGNKSLVTIERTARVRLV